MLRLRDAFGKLEGRRHVGRVTTGWSIYRLYRVLIESDLWGPGEGLFGKWLIVRELLWRVGAGTLFFRGYWWRGFGVTCWGLIGCVCGAAPVAVEILLLGAGLWCVSIGECRYRWCGGGGDNEKCLRRKLQALVFGVKGQCYPSGSFNFVLRVFLTSKNSFKITFKSLEKVLLKNSQKAFKKSREISWRSKGNLKKP